MVVMMRRMVMVMVWWYRGCGLAIWWEFEVAEARAALRSCTVPSRYSFIRFMMMVMTNVR